MDLHPELNLTNFGWSEKRVVRDAIRKRIEEEIKEYENQLKVFVKECLDIIYKDNEAFKLCSQFPAAFHKANAIDISGKQLGICSKDCFPDNYADIGDGKFYISSSLSFKLDSYCPLEKNRYRLTLELNLLPESKVEILKSIFSDYLSKKFEATKELHEFEEQEDNIKTVGRLYRVNQVWYEDLVRSMFPKYLEIPKPTKSSTESEEDAAKRRRTLSEDMNKKKLEGLKKVIVL